jgi:DNA-binding transcriptional MerR regulator
MELRRGMKKEIRAMILWRTEHELLTVEDLARAAGLHPEQVQKFVEFGLVEPVAGGGSHPMFAATMVERLRRAVRLKRDLGANLAGVAAILEMRERMENLQRELQHLRRRLGLEE